MTGLPTPEEFDASLVEIYERTRQRLVEAEKAGTRKEVAALRKLETKAAKLLRLRGVDPATL